MTEEPNVQPDQVGLIEGVSSGGKALTVVFSEALKIVADRSVSIEDRAPIYAVLRRMARDIGRATKSMSAELADALNAAGIEHYQGLTLTFRSVDPRYPINDPENWTDDVAQTHLEGWYNDAGSRPYIRVVPRHYEVDTLALRDALNIGDPGAIAFFKLLVDQGYRVDKGRKPELSVDG